MNWITALNWAVPITILLTLAFIAGLMMYFEAREDRLYRERQRRERREHFAQTYAPPPTRTPMPAFNQSVHDGIWPDCDADWMHHHRP